MTSLDTDNIFISGLKVKLHIFIVNTKRENKIKAIGEKSDIYGKSQKTKRFNVKIIPKPEAEENKRCIKSFKI